MKVKLWKVKENCFCFKYKDDDTIILTLFQSNCRHVKSFKICISNKIFQFNRAILVYRDSLENWYRMQDFDSFLEVEYVAFYAVNWKIYSWMHRRIFSNRLLWDRNSLKDCIFETKTYMNLEMNLKLVFTHERQTFIVNSIFIHMDFVE